ncbi:transcriptional regulatory protein ZraR [bacterium BMS3Abin05]|nr:transcriptional regulatory protein ZraR [bacterium BMS3Abin05]HDL77966.1 sigma-54-dependent Fis family transcriptional regulator [Bacteroidota bacterium]
MNTSEIGILIVDDESSVRDSLYKWFLEDGYRVDTAADAKEALRKLQKQTWDIILLDIKMPGMSGLELQERIREIDPGIVIIIITAYASVDTAVTALKAGAFDYVTKPFDPDELEHLIRNAAEKRQLTRENLQLKEKIIQLNPEETIIAESPQMKHILELVDTVAQTDSTVLIHGESGTGKEVIARAIHNKSKRRLFPMIAVNCGAFPETLLESELFGHEKGAFTGAQYRRKGKIELADGGTLFLDEIGDISPKTQLDLLRVLETHQFNRLGGNQLVQSDFRLICATNKNLEEEVRKGNFREDLFYRINVFFILIPPLRERKEDIPALVHFFIRKYARTMNKPIYDISPEAMALMKNYTWPGNVRELENAIERAMVIGKPPMIHSKDLPFAQTSTAAVSQPESDSLEAIEKAHISAVLTRTHWNIKRSAEILNIDRVTLYNKIKKYNLQRP